MEDGVSSENRSKGPDAKGMSKSMKKYLLVFNCVILSVGNCIAPLTNRLYSVKGGKRVWLMCALETAGFPFLVIPMIISYIYRRRKGGPKTKFLSMSRVLILPCIVIGILTGADDYMDSAGVSRLPVSTYSLVLSSQLGFTAFFAWILVKQKFTFLHFNAILLLTAGSVVLAFHTGSDLPAKESKADYVLGFLMTLGAAMLYGFVLPIIELLYKKAKQTITYSLVMEMQFVMASAATAFCVGGMIINKDFQAIPREAEKYELGKAMYALVLVADAFLWQLFFLGAVGVIFCHSSLLSGILISALLPLSEVLAVFIFNEKFTPEKGMSLFLSCWGSLSYFYEEHKLEKKKKQAAQNESKSIEVPGDLKKEKCVAEDDDQASNIP
ncbi:putative purine permease [Heracleum sosnowskyi]|uniref:Probable purine permease n=1 Tax=Heracleum sosnowskyi TaxID=360622 RepID=A0AAD8GQ62_9APIA|nr:putative purine permease [Heracleum sosnowskyi]